MKRRFSLGVRLLGSLCLLVFIAAVVWTSVVGVSFASGSLVAVALFGVAAPCVLGADSLVDALTGILELVGESISTLVEGVVDFLSSLF